MFKGKITTASAITANTNIPFNVVWNTNGNTQYDSTTNAVELVASGYYNVNVLLNVTASTPTTIGAQLYADGTAIAETLSATDITATTGIATLNIADTIKVIPQIDNGFAELSVRLNGNATVSNGLITIEKVR